MDDNAITIPGGAFFSTMKPSRGAPRLRAVMRPSATLTADGRYPGAAVAMIFLPRRN